MEIKLEPKYPKIQKQLEDQGFIGGHRQIVAFERIRTGINYLIRYRMVSKFRSQELQNKLIKRINNFIKKKLGIKMKVIAKFKVDSIEPNVADQTTLKMSAVTNGCEENKSFSRWTPAGNIFMVISNETPASKAFKVGKEYLVTFEDPEEHKK